MQPTFADFSARPPRLANVETRTLGGGPSGDHHVLDAGGHVELDFTLDPDELPGEATLKVVALVSKLGWRPGYAPMTVLVNDRELVANLTIPGGGDLPQDNVFAVPGGWLRAGVNTLTISSSPHAASMLWLYRVTLDEVYDRDRSERARLAAAAAESVFAFTTWLRFDAAGAAEGEGGADDAGDGADDAEAEAGDGADEAEDGNEYEYEYEDSYAESEGEAEDEDGEAPATWQPGPQLSLYVDRGEQAVPGQLSWRAVDGSEGAVSFQSAMSDFCGRFRTADGRLAELRGDLARRSAYPEGTQDSRLHRFSTHEGWGGGWHESGELRLLVEYGDSPVERIDWRDQRGNSGSVSVRADGSGFIGFYQRVHEGPIGYRGVAVGDVHALREDVTAATAAAAPTAPGAIDPDDIEDEHGWDVLAEDRTPSSAAMERSSGARRGEPNIMAEVEDLVEDLQSVGRRAGHVAELAIDKLTQWIEGRS